MEQLLLSMELFVAEHGAIMAQAPIVAEHGAIVAKPGAAVADNVVIADDPTASVVDPV